MDCEYICRLIIRRLQGKLSDGEDVALKKWFQGSLERQKLEARLKKDAINEDICLYASFDLQDGWKRVQSKLYLVAVQKRKWLWRSVAILAFGIGCSLFYYLGITEKRLEAVSTSVVSERRSDDKLPMLILENGKRVDLSRTATRELSGKNWHIEEDKNSLFYRNKTGERDTGWHILQVPRGGEYSLQLEDGTWVHLNSESELKYPICFAKGREVVLKGEAYFKVASDADKAFVVKTEQMKMRVYGTVFNVTAYPDDLTCVTLIGGCVGVSATDEQEEVKLQPGQQAMYKDGHWDVNRVDTSLYTAWNQGRFAFKSEELVQVLKKLERWYDVKFIIQDKFLVKKRFTGNMCRYETIDRILEMLALTTNVRFDMKENLIVVTAE